MSTTKDARSGLCRSLYNGAVLVDDRRKDTQGEIAKMMRGTDGISGAGTLQSMHNRGKEYRD
jgi:hypothetical protein